MAWDMLRDALVGLLQGDIAQGIANAPKVEKPLEQKFSLQTSDMMKTPGQYVPTRPRIVGSGNIKEDDLSMRTAVPGTVSDATAQMFVPQEQPQMKIKALKKKRDQSVKSSKKGPEYD